MSVSKLRTCLWFDGQATEAAKFYTSIFPNSTISETQHYTDAGKENHGHEPGSEMMVSFTLNGSPFLGLNGGPQFKFSEAVSFIVECDDQAEVDYYWDKLVDGGRESACGWLADRFGVSWQITPKALMQFLSDGDKAQKERVTLAMMGMRKLDIEVLKKAFEGKE